MPTILKILVVFIARSLAKVFLFLSLSISTPTINAMRSLEDTKAIVIVMESSSFRRRERGIGRRLGHSPTVQFVQFEIANYGV